MAQPRSVEGPDEKRLARLDKQALIACILGVTGMLGCLICSPFALFLGLGVHIELKSLGQPSNAKATVGIISGLVGSLMFVGFFFFLLFTYDRR